MIILIYNETPETIKLFRWDNPSSWLANTLRSAAGIYLNGASEEIATQEVKDLLNNIGQGNIPEDGVLILDDSDDKCTCHIDGPAEIIVAGFIL